MHAVQADVRRPGDAQTLVDAAVSRFGGLDVLVNNAGIGRFANVADMSVDDWHAIIETNLNGVFYCTRAAIPAMRRRGGGFIVNISSLAGKNAFRGGAAYCASKGALNNLAKQAAIEHAPEQVRVNVVAPSATAVQICDFDTLLHEQIWAAAGSASTPIAGFATPSDDGRIRNSGDSGSSMRFSIICSSVPYSAASPTITAPCRNLPQSDTTSFL